MKIIIRGCFLLITIFFFSINSIHSQDSGEWVSYSRKISVSQYAGQMFRFHARVKTTLDDDSASARLWIRTDNGKRMGFFDNMEKMPIRSIVWTDYAIEGRIDSGMVNLAFGFYCTLNGFFCFDNVLIETCGRSGQWTTIFSDDFENGKQSFVQGLQLRNEGLSPYFTASIETEGKERYLQIQGKQVPNYGINNKAGHYVSVNGIQLYFENYGSGKPLLILHGNGGSIKDASPFYPELIKKYRVIAIDSRSQGRTIDTSATLTYEQMADDIYQLLNQLKLDSVLIWGHSDGAIIGLILAIHHPEKVEKLLAFGANIQPDSLAIFPWALAYIQKKTKYPGERKLNQLMLDEPNIPYSELVKIKAPVLIMSGDRDMIRPEHTLQLFQHISHAQLCIIPGSTHYAAWENEGLFLQLLEHFFDNPFTMPDTKNKWRN